MADVGDLLDELEGSDEEPKDEGRTRKRKEPRDHRKGGRKDEDAADDDLDIDSVW